MMNTWTNKNYQSQKWLSRCFTLLAAFCVVFSLQAQITLTTPGGNIPSVGTAGTDNYINNFCQPGVMGTNWEISSVVVEDVTHTFASDIELTLISPAGTRVALMLDDGGSTGLDAGPCDLVFVPGGDDPDDWDFAGDTSDPCAGDTFDPALETLGDGGSLTSFNGEAAMGDWTLEVNDDAGGDSGSFTDFSITFTAITPVNGDCVDATVLPAATATYCGSSFGADADQPLPPGVGCGIGDDTDGNGVWYTFTGNGNAWTFDFPENSGQSGSLFDSEITVFTSAGGCGGPFICAGGDDDSGPGFSATLTIPATIPGTTYYLYAHDAFSGVADFQFTVTTAPVVVAVCQTNAICTDATVLLAADGTGAVTAADVDGGSFADCGLTQQTTTEAIIAGQTAFTCADVGAQFVVTLQATNDGPLDAGQTDQCTATVTVLDEVNPVATCNNINVNLDANGVATTTAAAIQATATDACGIVSSDIDITTFTCADVTAVVGAPIDVTLTVLDPSGNPGTCVGQVTVIDAIAPVAVCQDITVQLDGTGNASATAAQVDNGSSDNCSVTLSLTPTAFTCANVGAPVTVTLTATDPSGNTDDCTALVTVEDNINPVANCTNTTIELDANGEASIANLGQTLGGGSTDNCPPLSFEPGDVDFTCANIGANNITVTVTDPSGNSASCTAVVTVQDNIDPHVVCRPDINTQTSEGLCSVDLILLDPWTSDNCGINSITRTPAGDTFTPGITTVTWSVTDQGGNTVTCEQTVTVFDNEAPSIEMPYDIIECTDPPTPSGFGVCSAKVQIDPVISDNCGVASVSGVGIFTFAVGVHEHVITVTDVNSNVSTHTVIVQIHDCEAPAIECAEDPIVVNSPNNNPTSVFLPQPATSDNCGVASVTNDAPDEFPLGEHIVTWTATDLYGNESTCTVTVIVEPAVWPDMGNLQASIPEGNDDSYVNWNAPSIGIFCEECGETDIPNYVYLGDFFGHQYFMHIGQAGFDDAQWQASLIGGHIVTINNAQENYFLAGVMPTDVDNVLIGFTDEFGEEDGDYTWANEDDITYVNFGLENIPTSEELNYTTLDQEGMWELVSNEPQFFIVERPCVEVVQTGPIVEVENNDGTVEEVLLEAGDWWPEGDYTVTYQAMDLCGNTGMFGFDVNVMEPEVDYCTIASNDNDDIWIEQVTLGTFAQESEADEDGYADFTDNSFELVNMAEDDETPFTNVYLQAGGNDDEQTLYWNIFFDMNSDGDFFDAGEMIFQAAGVDAIEATLALPYAETNTTRMRVMVSRFGYSESCGDLYTGEIEDYMVSLDNPFEFAPEGNTLGLVTNVYPNPTTDFVMVELSEVNVPATITIFDAMGKLMYSQDIENGNQFRIELSGYAAGIYRLQVTPENGVSEVHPITVMNRP